MPNNYHDQSTNEPVECETCFTPLDEDLKCKPCDEKLAWESRKMSKIKPITELKHRLSKRRKRGSPVTEFWFKSVCFSIGICPVEAKLTCANKGWLARASNKRFFPATNLVAK